MPDPRIVAVHVYTFNQLAETERWRQRMLQERAR
jgi:hypothetical protein